MITKLLGRLPKGLFTWVAAIAGLLILVFSAIALRWGIAPNLILGFWGFIVGILILSEIPNIVHNHIMGIAAFLIAVLICSFVFIKLSDGIAPPATADCVSALQRVGVNDTNIESVLGAHWPTTVDGLSAQLQGCEAPETTFVLARYLATFYFLGGCQTGQCPEASLLQQELTKSIEGLDLWAFEQALNSIAHAAEVQAQERLLLTPGATLEVLVAYSLLVVVVWLLSEGLWFLPGNHWVWAAAVSAGLFVSSVAMTYIVGYSEAYVPYQTNHVMSSLNGLFYTGLLLVFFGWAVGFAVVGTLALLGKHTEGGHGKDLIFGGTTAVVSGLVVPPVLFGVFGRLVVDQALASTPQLEVRAAVIILLLGVMCGESVQGAIRGVLRVVSGDAE